MGDFMRITNTARAAVAAVLIALGLLAGSGVAGASTDWTGNPDSVRITGDIQY